MKHTPEFYVRHLRGPDCRVRICDRCHVEKDKTEFPSDPNRRMGIYPICNECQSASHRDLYKRKPEIFKCSVVKWENQNPEKRRAYVAVRLALTSGKLAKPDKCSVCGFSGRVEAHHWKGYEKEFILDVQWVCRKCHRKIEKSVTIPS